MIDPELAARLDAIEAKATAAYVAAEKVRTYLFWTGAVTVALVVLPMIGLIFAIPMFVHNYVDPLNASAGGSQTSTIDLINSLGL